MSIVVTSALCGGNPITNTAYIDGGYQARPKGESGLAHITFTDTGVTGPSKGDYFSISLEGGAFGGYENAGTLGGGNFTVNG